MAIDVTTGKRITKKLQICKLEICIRRREREIDSLKEFNQKLRADLEDRSKRLRELEKNYQLTSNQRAEYQSRMLTAEAKLKEEKQILLSELSRFELELLLSQYTATIARLMIAVVDESEYKPFEEIFDGIKEKAGEIEAELERRDAIDNE